MTRSLRWGECTWEEVRDAANQGAIAVAPFGSVEQHGPMIPVDTDVRNAERWALDGARIANEKYGVQSLVMPTMPYGVALHHMRFAGTVSLQPETYIAAIVDILRCAVLHGFRKIAVVSGHGRGNMESLQLGMVKVVNEFADRFSLRIALYTGASRDQELAAQMRELWKDEPREGQPGIHASRQETSKTLADRPQLVRTDRLQRPVLERQTVPEWEFRTEEMTRTGAYGDPSLARAEIGAKLWTMQGESVARFLKRLADEAL